MPEQYILSTEIICALITITGSVITCAITNSNAKHRAEEVATSEVEKLTRTWQREDRLSAESAFREMCETVARFVHDNCGTNQGIALEKVAGMRAIFTGEIATQLDALYDSIQRRNSQASEAQLTKAIKLHRMNETAVVEPTKKKRWSISRKN